jgi:hypothetical protein
MITTDQQDLIFDYVMQMMWDICKNIEMVAEALKPFIKARKIKFIPE